MTEEAPQYDLEIVQGIDDFAAEPIGFWGSSILFLTEDSAVNYAVSKYEVDMNTGFTDTSDVSGKPLTGTRYLVYQSAIDNIFFVTTEKEREDIGWDITEQFLLKVNQDVGESLTAKMQPLQK